MASGSESYRATNVLASSRRITHICCTLQTLKSFGIHYLTLPFHFIESHLGIIILKIMSSSVASLEAMSTTKSTPVSTPQMHFIREAGDGKWHLQSSTVLRVQNTRLIGVV
jgi:hypothetical protein